MKRNILAVDNNEMILQFMADLLSQEGHQIVTAKDGLAALEILKTYNPDVIFVDLVMPNIGGKKLCQVIRKIPKLKDVHICILSAIAAEEGIHYEEFGANDCIAKGPLHNMAEHILGVLDSLNFDGEGKRKEEVMGMESMFPREITRELLSIKKHFEIILGSMREGVLEITPEARIVYANPFALSLIGIPEEKLLGKNFFELFSETHHERLRELLKRSDNKPQTISEDSPLDLNRKKIAVEILPLKEENRKSLVILNDVSLRKEMEAKLFMAQKMEAIGTLAGGIAHDFNNLLMGIQGNVSLMVHSMEATHPHYEKLKTMEKLVERASRLTSQLLGYARKGKYEIKSINLNQLVDEISDTFGRTRKDITVYLRLAENLFDIEGDEGQIEQVLLNLYVNAADAMSEGGELIVTTKNLTHEDIREKPFEPKPGNYVLLTVTDTGIGMDEETAKRIFEPFFTTKELGRGTGLGLASVYGIIKGHGGYIEVESKKEYGSTFKVYLPATQKERPKDDNPPVKKGKAVLLVDDEETILKIAQQLLETLGFWVLTARDGKEAIQVYAKHQDTIDMVILDMIMPKMGGSETYEKLRDINPDVKVLLTSGYSIEGELSRLLERGCNGFLQKPFKLEQLSTSLFSILGKK